jgi:hypothetical protein
VKSVTIVNPWQAPWSEVILYERRLSPGIKGRTWREPLVTAQLLHQNGWDVAYLPFSEIRQNPVLEDPTIWKFFYDLLQDVESNILIISPVYNMASSCHNNSIKIARAFKETHPDGKTIFTGFHVSAVPELSMQDEIIDVIALYDAPLILSIIVPLVSKLNRNENLKDIKGIYYRENGYVKFNPPACPIADPSKLPPPKYDLLKPYFSRLIRKSLNNRVPLTLRTSYGCPNSCDYCYFNPNEWKGMRTIPPENFKKELEYLFDVIDKEKLVFRMCGDELFISSNTHLRGIVNVLREMDVTFEEAVLEKATTFTKEIYQKGLNSANRQQDFSAYLKGLAHAKEAGLDIYISWLCGLPEETPQSIALDFLMAEELFHKGLMDYAIPCILAPFPWTDIYRNPLKHGITIVDRNWDHYTEMCWYPVYYTRHLTRAQIHTSFLFMEMMSRTFSRLVNHRPPFKELSEELTHSMQKVLEHPDKSHIIQLIKEIGKNNTGRNENP